MFWTNPNSVMVWICVIGIVMILVPLTKRHRSRIILNYWKLWSLLSLRSMKNSAWTTLYKTSANNSSLLEEQIFSAMHTSFLSSLLSAFLCGYVIWSKKHYMNVSEQNNKKILPQTNKLWMKQSVNSIVGDLWAMFKKTVLHFFVFSNHVISPMNTLECLRR